jgi:hypothetical protein
MFYQYNNYKVSQYHVIYDDDDGDVDGAACQEMMK